MCLKVSGGYYRQLDASPVLRRLLKLSGGQKNHELDASFCFRSPPRREGFLTGGGPG